MEITISINRAFEEWNTYVGNFVPDCFNCKRRKEQKLEYPKMMNFGQYVDYLKKYKNYRIY